SSFLGKPIFIIFWAPDCYHCKTVMPFINNLYDKYNDSIEFVGFAIDKDLQAIKVAAKEEKIKFKVITDLQGYDGENCLRWFVWGTPTFFIIDKYGKIFSSPYSYEGIEQDLENVLKL
ncbi:MAG TPA: TlpA disulfide reductase family protein, partial [Bacteroidales bacterium]|nr:TlpA disulfide reductase family protein [Bacteroidales bacterium]